MEQWEKYKLQDICTVINGAGFNRSDFAESGIPVVKTANVKPDRIILDGLTCVSETAAKKKAKSMIKPGDIILVMTGNKMDGNPDNRVGRLALFQEKGNYILNQRLCLIRGNQELVNSEYLVYYLSAGEVQNYFMDHATCTGRQVNISLSTVYNCMLKVPNLETQDRIVSRLKGLDLEIRSHERTINQLEQQAQTYFNENYIENRNPEWKEGTLADLGKIVSGGTPSKEKQEYYSEHGVAWITLKDLSDSKEKFISHGKKDISELGVKHCSAVKMPAGTVLFSSRASIGHMAIALNELTTNQGFRSVIPKENIGTAFVYFILKYSLPVIEKMASGHYIYNEISGKDMKMVPVLIPDEDTIQKINEYCNPIFGLQRKLEEEIRNLKQKKETLLTEILAGRFL